MIVITILLLVLFFGVTIAGGRAHVRANEEAARKLKVRQAAAGNAAIPSPDRADSGS
jgi:hypothetical protein